MKEDLTALYKRWDTNADGYLDKAELAVGFRGKGAKPLLNGRPSAEDVKRHPDFDFLTRLDRDGDV